MKLLYPFGKTKAVTFSYDDGIYQDKRFISILDKYHLKATFNVASGLLGRDDIWETKGVKVPNLVAAELNQVYQGHEIAGHSVSHPNLADVDEKTLYLEVQNDKYNLERITGLIVEGFAYPFGGFNNNVKRVLKESGFKYGRTVLSNGKFDPPEDFYEWHPTCHHNDPKLYQYADELCNSESEELRIFYIWGHSYEFDTDDTWGDIERFCNYISGKEDIWYATNIEIVNYLVKAEELQIDDDKIINNSDIDVWISHNDKIAFIPALTAIKKDQI